MIQILNVSLAFGGRTVLDGVNWTIKSGKRIGLIGPNGAGKSTLLRVIAGAYPPDSGQVTMPGDTTVGYLAQDVQETPGEQTVLEAAMEAFREVRELEAEERQITDALAEELDHTTEAYAKLLDRLERVHTRLQTHEAHLIQPKTEAVLTGLGFDPDELDRPLRTFSGGWRMRVALARILLREPGFLFLDEPTNHLDIDSIDWLETYLKSYPGTVVIVSHDRYFLDRMVTTTAELSQGKVTEYAGNYTYYLEARKERRALQRAAYENQQKEIAEMERFIERFRAKATKAKQAQSRIKALEKLERIPPPPSDEASITFRFPEPERSGRVVLELSSFSKTYETDEGPLTVFDEAGPLKLERGDKIALIGPNGAGKSTLARILNGAEPFDGTRELGYRVAMTFFAQHQADSLDPRHTILDSLKEVARGHTETELRSILGAFLFTGDDVFKSVAVLSGGEKSRVALARTLLHPANFLILDEPTNHLDIQSIQVLIEALNQYSGSFVIVSHDRHFLDQVVNKVWRVDHGDIREYLGTFSEYQWQVQNGTRQPTTAPAVAARNDAPKTHKTPEAQPKAAASGPKTKEQKRKEAQERNRRYQELQAKGKTDYTILTPHQLRKALQKAEAKILKLEERQAELEAALADPDNFQDADRARQLTSDYDALKADIKEHYETWEEIGEHLADAQAS